MIDIISGVENGNGYNREFKIEGEIKKCLLE